MKMRIAISLSVMVLMNLGGPAKAGESAKATNARRLEALKQLAGDWIQLGADGKPTDKVVSSIRVTAGGSTVQETLFPGTDHEMVTMYHLDGADLILTHYCMLGNQPRMRAEPGTDVNTIAFTFVGGTNLNADADQHMHQATLTLQDKDHFRAEWTACKEGKSCHHVQFDLVRKAK
jgi:hypothetical protein